LLVANDAGARHVAAAFEVPSVVFFGPTSVTKTAENLARVEVLETQHACRPCYRRECPIDHRCLTSIDVAEALDAIDRALFRQASLEPTGPQARSSGAGRLGRKELIPGGLARGGRA
jgi:heptosyltransferase-2